MGGNRRGSCSRCRMRGSISRLMGYIQGVRDRWEPLVVIPNRPVHPIQPNLGLRLLPSSVLVRPHFRSPGRGVKKKGKPCSDVADNESANIG